VSNSSSSSFTCGISGRTESGWDMGLIDAEMYECVNGHTMGDSYVTGNLQALAEEGLDACLAVCESDEMKTALKERMDDVGEDHSTGDLFDALCEILDDWGGRYELPASLCPLCTLKYVNNHDVLRYLLLRMDRTYKQVCEEIAATYGGNPSDFREAIKGVSLNAKD